LAEFELCLLTYRFRCSWQCYLNYSTDRQSDKLLYEP